MNGFARVHAEAQRPIRTLQDELGTTDFAERGWYRLADLADYLSFLVDARSVGSYEEHDPYLYQRVVGLASVVKAAVQWFALDKDNRPEFVRLAEKYLGNSEPHGSPIFALVVDERFHQCNLTTGPVVQRKGGRHGQGRVQELSEMKKAVVAHLRSNEDPRVPRWRNVGQGLIGLFAQGALSDLFHEQRFQWTDDVLESVATVLKEYFTHEVRLEEVNESEAAAERIAEGVIRVALEAMGLAVPKDFFRDRRGDSGT